MYIPHIRRIYSRPWQVGRLTNPGKVAACVQVAVRPETTFFADKTMANTRANGPATRTSFTGVSRVDVLHGNTGGLCLVFDKSLQLSECPTMQPSPHPVTSFDPVSDIGQILHCDFGDAFCYRFLNNRFACLK